MSKFYAMRHEGYWWHACLVNGKVYLLAPIGPIGHCLRF